MAGVGSQGTPEAGPQGAKKTISPERAYVDSARIAGIQWRMTGEARPARRMLTYMAKEPPIPIQL